MVGWLVSWERLGVTWLSSVSKEHCDVFTVIDGSSCVLSVSRIAGKENVDPNLRDFQPPKKQAKIIHEPGAQFKWPMVVLLKGFVPANTQKNNTSVMCGVESTEKKGNF